MQRDLRRKNGAGEAQALSLQGARRTDPREIPHQHPQIVSARVNQQPLLDVLASPQVHPSQAARQVHVRHRAFRLLRPLHAQCLAARARHPLPVRCHRFQRLPQRLRVALVDFEGILRSLPAVDSSKLPPLPILASEINKDLASRLGRPDASGWTRVMETAAAGRFNEALAALESAGASSGDWLRDYLTVNVNVWLDDYESAALAEASPALSNQALQAVQTLRAEVFRQVSIEYFDRLVNDHPSSCRARLDKAMNYAAREMAEAEGEFLAAIEACPFDIQLRIELADYYLWKSQYSEARQACLDELEIHPHSSTAKKRLGRIHVQLPEAEQALPLLHPTIEAGPQDAAIRTDLGPAYELLQRWEDALALYHLALELDPTLNRVHYVLARIYFQLGQPELAQEQFRRFKQNEDRARQTRTERGKQGPSAFGGCARRKRPRRLCPDAEGALGSQATKADVEVAQFIAVNRGGGLRVCRLAADSSPERGFC